MTDFYEDDEPAEKIEAIFERLEKSMTEPPVTLWQTPAGSVTLRCDHLVGAPRLGRTPMVPAPIQPDGPLRVINP